MPRYWKKKYGSKGFLIWVGDGRRASSLLSLPIQKQPILEGELRIKKCLSTFPCGLVLWSLFTPRKRRMPFYLPDLPRYVQPWMKVHQKIIFSLRKFDTSACRLCDHKTNLKNSVCSYSLTENQNLQCFRSGDLLTSGWKLSVKWFKCNDAKWSHSCIMLTHNYTCVIVRLLFRLQWNSWHSFHVYRTH